MRRVWLLRSRNALVYLFLAFLKSLVVGLMNS